MTYERKDESKINVMYKHSWGLNSPLFKYPDKI